MRHTRQYTGPGTRSARCHCGCRIRVCLSCPGKLDGPVGVRRAAPADAAGRDCHLTMHGSRRLNTTRIADSRLSTVIAKKPDFFVVFLRPQLRVDLRFEPPRHHHGLSLVNAKNSGFRRENAVFWCAPILYLAVTTTGAKPPCSSTAGRCASCRQFQYLKRPLVRSD